MTEATAVQAQSETAAASPAAPPVERGRRLRLALAVAGFAGLCAIPLALNPFQVGLAALALTYGLFAFGLDIAWGRAGIVSIGHAIFFGLGAYGVALAERAQVLARACRKCADSRQLARSLAAFHALLSF